MSFEETAREETVSEDPNEKTNQAAEPAKSEDFDWSEPIAEALSEDINESESQAAEVATDALEPIEPVIAAATEPNAPAPEPEVQAVKPVSDAVEPIQQVTEAASEPVVSTSESVDPAADVALDPDGDSNGVAAPVAEIAAEPQAAAPEEVEQASDIASDAVEPIQQVTEAASNPADAVATPAVDGAPPVEPAAPKVLDLATIDLRTTAIEKDLEVAEHRVSLTNRLTALQDALDLLEPSEDRAALDARLAAVQSSIAEQAQERIVAKEAIIVQAESLVESQEWKATSEAFRDMQEQLRAIGAAGKELDDPLWERFRAARSGFHERRQAFFAERQKHWEESKAKKEALTAEAEALAEVEDFRDKSARARNMMNDWKAAGFAGREAEDALWPRFRGALDKFYERRAALYQQNLEQKTLLVVRAEELAESTDWRTSGEAMKRLMAEWKTLGSAGREHDDPLWERFRGAQQRFHEARSANFAERENLHRENVARKEELCEQAESIALRDDMRGAIQEIITLQAEWKQVGFIPREQSDALWRRFKAACDGVFSHVDLDREERQQSREQGYKDAAGRKREQYQRLNESIAHDQANINRWRETISSLSGGGRADQIRTELEDRVIEVMLRVRDKQARAEELAVDLQQMEAQAQ